MKIRKKSGKFKPGKYTSAVTPYRFRRIYYAGCAGPEWAITYGRSAFLVAKGSSWSMPEGRAIFRMLEDAYWGRSVSASAQKGRKT